MAPAPRAGKSEILKDSRRAFLAGTVWAIPDPGQVREESYWLVAKWSKGQFPRGESIDLIIWSDLTHISRQVYISFCIVMLLTIPRTELTLSVHLHWQLSMIFILQTYIIYLMGKYYIVFLFQRNIFSLCDFESHLTGASLQMQRKNISTRNLCSTLLGR